MATAGVSDALSSHVGQRCDLDACRYFGGLRWWSLDCHVEAVSAVAVSVDVVTGLGGCQNAVYIARESN